MSVKKIDVDLILKAQNNWNEFPSLCTFSSCSRVLKVHRIAAKSFLFEQVLVSERVLDLIHHPHPFVCTQN